MMAVSQLRRTVASLSLLRPGHEPKTIHVGFVMDEVALGEGFSPNSSVLPS
jgi:hypothetical protein